MLALFLRLTLVVAVAIVAIVVVLFLLKIALIAALIAAIAVGGLFLYRLVRRRSNLPVIR
ncbi:MAG TPA: hypothetical protein VFF63_03895 [Candidatus Babeliales bacterium]|nr:hypothetical protein [Candidatus Babeliales bacterium]